MPEYEHLCENPECLHEWEDFYSIKDDPPKICPKCQQETAKRLISCHSKGKVELYGQELHQKLKEEGAAIRKEAYSSEKVYANIIGEDRYQSIQTQMDRRPKPQRPRIMSRKS